MMSKDRVIGPACIMGAGLLLLSTGYYIRLRRKHMRQQLLPCESLEERFDLGAYGFAHVMRPCRFKQWEKIASKMSKQSIRPDVDKLAFEEVDWSSLPLREAQRCYAVLAMIAHAYVWGSGEEEPEILPRQIAIPLFQATKIVGLEHPVLTHSALDLWNLSLRFSIKEKLRALFAEAHDDLSAGENPDNWIQLCSLTGKRGELWFHAVAASTQILGGQLLAPGYDLLLNYTDKACMIFLIKALDCLQRCNDVLKGMYANLEPGFFFSTYRHYLNGWNATKKKSLLFEGIGDISCNGATAAQVVFVPVLDHMFSIRHEKSREDLEMFREYMPKKHREFLETMEKLSPIKDQSELPQIHALVDRCIEALHRFRTSHKGLAKRYIADMIRKEESVGQDKDAIDLIGTGGTSFTDFLSDLQNDTLSSSL